MEGALSFSTVPSIGEIASKLHLKMKTLLETRSAVF